MKNFILGFLLAAVLAGGGYWVTSRKDSQPMSMPAAQTQKYHCPMHPAYVSDKPGDCPICGMRLVPLDTVDTKDPPAGHQASQSENKHQRRVLYYVDPMNPSGAARFLEWVGS